MLQRCDGTTAVSAAFGKQNERHRIKVIGSVNLGYVLIAFKYLLSWVLAIVYGRIAADRFDPLAARAAMEIFGRDH